MSAEPAENAVAVVETMKERRLRTLELYTKRQLIHQKDGDPHIGYVQPPPFASSFLKEASKQLLRIVAGR